jgi:hypothetical protein
MEPYAPPFHQAVWDTVEEDLNAFLAKFVDIFVPVDRIKENTVSRFSQDTPYILQLERLKLL